MENRVHIKPSVRHTEDFLDLININKTSEESKVNKEEHKLKQKRRYKKTLKNREKILIKSYEALYDSYCEQISDMAHDREKDLLKKKTSRAFASQILDDVDRVLERIANRHVYFSLFLIGTMLAVYGLEVYLNMSYKTVFRVLWQFYISLCILDLFKYKRAKSKLENVVDLTFSSEIKHIQKGLKALEHIKSTWGYYGRVELDYICLGLVCLEIAVQYI